MTTEKQPRVKLTPDSHTQIRIWAAVHRVTIQTAIQRAIDLLMQTCPSASTQPGAKA